MSLPRIAIVAAMPGEIQPLVRGWATAWVKSQGGRLRLFQRARAFATWSGMGAAPVRQAARALVERMHPDLLISAGWAGSLVPGIKVGDIVVPEVVVDAADGRAFRAYCGAGVLLTAHGVLNSAEKADATARHSAQAIDMEAAAVAAVAQETNTRFLAVKTIFDEHDFALPPVGRFVSPRGGFRYASFLLWLAMRPGEWHKVPAMRRNSSKSARKLAVFLEELLACDSLVEIQQQVARRVLGLL